ncbi:CotY/CotZ family spore coat protein [Gracilibacillus sp. YIM 98692]|uniref:CotY/CotZ family spore coat protein n=1 Tax=Gracilibacillus sp. YIM 98692 TaxID=2663532 RepID=UPI0013D25708|nr:CotY/CotZ family spore coat protein [Gracilibacillus sp. YIM 98692]
MGRTKNKEVSPARDNNCVCDVVEAIADAQDDVLDQHCDISCARSIQNLVSPVAGNGLDTVPFILFDKKGKPFKGVGVEVQQNGSPTFECVESFIFRVNKVDDCCAVLELLIFDDETDPCHDPCQQLGKVEDLERTGICITVDLNCFCAITCLPAVSVL